MGRLIDADALKERIRSFLGIKSLDDLLPEEKAIVQHIDRMPTVDAVPVRYGRWVHHPEIGWGSTWLCSECGEKTVESIMGEPRYKFCPMCGADMRKDGDQ